MKLLATILSTIFHPLLMPTYGIAIALYTSYMRVFGDRLLGIIVIGVLLTTCILPSLGIFILYKTGHISDFRLHNRTERTVPYRLVGSEMCIRDRAYRSVYHQLCLLYRMLSLLIPFRDTELDTLFHSGCDRLAYHFFIYQPILENKRTHGSGRSDGCIGIPNEHL